MRDFQKYCRHEWADSTVPNYSHCLICGLMRDDKDGDLFDPQDLEEASSRVTATSLIRRFWFWLNHRRKLKT